MNVLKLSNSCDFFLILWYNTIIHHFKFKTIMIKQLLKLSFGAVFVTVLTSCGNNNVISVVSCPDSVGGVTSTLNNGRCYISAGTMNLDAVLDNTRTWVLQGGLVVNSSTLTINAGTQIKAEDIGFLAITANGSIKANGTGSNPVKFSSIDDNYDGRAEWGGIYIGSGGDNLLDYTVVAEAGSTSMVVDGTAYQDNIVFNGASSKTILSFVQSHNANRDGVHLLTTDARLSWILVTGSGRDGVLVS